MKYLWLMRGLRFALLALALASVVVFGVYWLWNWLIPSIFHGPAISVPQTLGLLVLLRLLGAGLGRLARPADRMRRRAWHQRVAGRLAGLSETERETFKQQMAQRCAAGWVCPKSQAAESTDAPVTAQA